MRVEIKNVKLCGWRHQRCNQNIEWCLKDVKDKDTRFYVEIPGIKSYDGQKYIVGNDSVVVYPLDILDIEVNMYTDRFNNILLVLTKITHVEQCHKEADDYSAFEKVADEILFDIKEIDNAFNNIIKKCDDSNSYMLSRYKAKKIQETFDSLKAKLKESKEKIEECGIKYTNK